jgi:hypothetical protein
LNERMRSLISPEPKIFLVDWIARVLIAPDSLILNSSYFDAHAARKTA